MQCEEVREQFADYVIDQLREPTLSRVSQHLTACQECRNEADELKALWATLGSIPAAEPGPELRSRFQMMLEAYNQGLVQAPGKSRWERLNSWLGDWWPQRPVLQLGLALGLLVLGIVVGRQVQP